MFLVSSSNTYLGASIEPLCVGDEHLELLGKLCQSAAWVTAGGDEHTRVDLPCTSILVVDVRALHGSVVILKLNLVTKLGLLMAQLSGDGLAL